ncbi:MAG: hypothetical protein GYB67_07485 [Chloroflexi bacterium]|nr:hypothetical protein [Chloroflexota bacterium]
MLVLLAVSVTQVAANDNNVNWNELGHNSRDPLYRSPGGAVPTGTEITLRLRALNDDLTAAQVRVWNDRINVSTIYDMTRVASNVTFPNDPTVYEFWEVTLPASADPTIYWYRFIAIDGGAVAYYEDDDRRTGGWGQPFGSSPDNSWQLTHYDPAFQTPDWVKNAVMYQIFTDRFRDGNPTNHTPPGEFFYNETPTVYRSNATDWNTAICDPRNVLGGGVCPNVYSQNFYGGDLQGIIDRLDYLQGLGVTALYLNPIFESPSNHKYDTTDFLQIDDNFGDLALFQTLAAEAHNRGINIVLDGVFNHSSSDSIYFDRYSRWDVNGNPTPIGTNDASGACESLNSPFINWYPFEPYNGPGTAPCSDNRDYQYWFGIFDSLPVMAHDDPGVRDYFINQGVNSVGPYWMQWADGWRLDVAPEVDPGQINDPADDYWEAFRAAVHAVDPDAYIVGEEWGNPTSWTVGGEWDATMNYQFAAAVLSLFRDTTYTDNDFNAFSSAGELVPLSPSEFNERILNLEERYAPEAFAAMMNLLGSHDTNRPLFTLDHNTGSNNTALYNDPNYDWSDSINRLRGVALVQMTMPGAPTIYYGDEVGLVGPVSFDGSQWQDDPYNRQPYPWLDQSGTPFYAHLQSQAAQDNLSNYYSLLTATRNNNPALRTGSLDPLLIDDGAGLYAYGRKLADDSNAAVMVVNRTGADVNAATVNVRGYLPAGLMLTNALDGANYTVDANGNINVGTVPARGGLLLTAAGFVGRPMAVNDLTATPGSGEITLNWTAPAVADNFRVYRSRLSDGGYSFIGETGGTSFTDSGLDNATRYYYVVVSENSTTLLQSEHSNEVNAVPQFDLATAWFNLQWPYTIDHVLNATIPTTTIYGQIFIAGATDIPGGGPVTTITAQVGYGPEADDPAMDSWTWFPMEPNPGYDFENNNNDEWQGTMLPTEVGTFKYTTRWSADGGNTWFYTDRVGPPYDAADAGDLTVTASTDTTPPDAPTNLVVVATSAVSVTLGWDQHPDTDGDLYGFQVYRENVAAPGFTLIDTIIDPLATSYVDGSVTTGEIYNYYLQALDTSLNASAQSNTVEASAVMREVDVTFRAFVPDHTPGTVYLAGNFGPDYPQWDPGALALTEVAPGTWEITLTVLDGTAMQYKFTRGAWEMVEKGADGNFEIADRQATASYGTTGQQIIDHTVENWRDPYVVVPAPTGAAWPDTLISADWNQAMVESSTDDTHITAPNAMMVTGPNGPVSGTLSYDSSAYRQIFTPDSDLAPGIYDVTINGRRDVGGDMQQFEAAWSFGVQTAPQAATLMQPTGSYTTAPSDFTWSYVPGATWYLLWVSRADGTLVHSDWYDQALVCSASDCTVSLNLNLTGGEYRWWVQTWNEFGFGPWSAEVNFTMEITPAAAVLGAPTGAVSDTQPTFTWQADADSTWSLLWVSRADGTLVHSDWYDQSVICTGADCAVTLNIPMVGGDYRWWVLTWNAYGFGPWSAEANFTLALPPMAAAPLTPAGQITDTQPTFTWDAVPGASWYLLWLSDVTGPTGTQVFNGWVEASSVCANGTCAVTPSLTLGDGRSYRWWLRTWNEAGGFGPWSDSVDFAIAGGPIFDIAPGGDLSSQFNSVMPQQQVAPPQTETETPNFVAPPTTPNLPPVDAGTIDGNIGGELGF